MIELDKLKNNLYRGGNVTINAGSGNNSLHLYAMRWKDNEIDKEISVHMSIEEAEEFIKELKRRLVLCYKHHVEAL